MVGVVVVGHFNLAKELVAAAELIIGKHKHIAAIDIQPDEDVDKTKNRVAAAIKNVNTGDGVIILTDMFGGTPSNIGLSFLEEGRVEVVTGVNLPMLIKLITYRENRAIDELSPFIAEYGQKNIYLATDVLKSRKKE